MPVGTRSSSKATLARPAGRPEATGLLSLSDDLLLLCLNHMSQRERFQHVSLVCKRFRELCLAPQLLRSIDYIPPVRDTALLRLEALGAFLAAHRQHIELLRINLLFFPSLSDGDEGHSSQLLHTALEGCGGAGSSLRELEVAWDGWLATGTWLPGLTALQRLELALDEGELRLSGSSQLQHLVDADLSAWRLHWGAEERLPPSLTRLRWSDDIDRQLPLQLSQLTALASVHIFNSYYSTEDLLALTTLTSLRKLRLEALGQVDLPSVLSPLTWLEQLAIRCDRPIHEELNTALPSLQHLTCLSIRYGHLRRIPLGLAGLSRLQRLYLNGPPANGADLSLPQGPWLACIRWLGLPWKVLATAAGTLRNATRLEYLCVLWGGDRPVLPEGNPLWTVAATHTTLRCLAFGMVKTWFVGHPHVSNASALQALSLTRPKLLIRFLESTSFEDELLGCDSIPEDGTYH